MWTHLSGKGVGPCCPSVTTVHDEETQVCWVLQPLPSFPQNAFFLIVEGNPEWQGKIKPAIASILFLLEH